MKELVEYIARAIAKPPPTTSRSPRRRKTARSSSRLEVHPDDKGKVIGRQGRVAQAMRTLIRVAAVKEDTRANLEIV